MGPLGTFHNCQALQVSVGCNSASNGWSSKTPPGHQHTPLNWLKIETEQTGNFWTNASRLRSTRYSCNHPQLPPTEQKAKTIQFRSWKIRKKCSSTYEIKAYGYFLQEVLQWKRGSLQDTTEWEYTVLVHKLMRSVRMGAQDCSSYYAHHSFLTHEGNYILQ